MFSWALPFELIEVLFLQNYVRQHVIYLIPSHKPRHNKSIYYKDKKGSA